MVNLATHAVNNRIFAKDYDWLARLGTYIQVEASLTFNRNLRTLAKKYRRIRNDIQPIYAKSEQVDIAAKDIQNIIAEYEQQKTNDEEDNPNS